jgi:hypothetical protein
MRAREARRIEVEVAKKARIRQKRFIVSWTIIVTHRFAGFLVRKT